MGSVFPVVSRTSLPSSKAVCTVGQGDGRRMGLEGGAPRLGIWSLTCSSDWCGLYLEYCMELYGSAGHGVYRVGGQSVS